MSICTILFLFGILLSYFFRTPHDLKCSLIVLAIAVVSVIFKYTRFIAFFAFGFVWLLFCAEIISAWTLPEILEGKTIQIIGTIASIPNDSNHMTSFLFSIKKIQSENNNYPAKGLIHLSWRNAIPNLKVGDEWQLTARLKKIHGTRNPGEFDYEAWAFQEGIRASGYIVNEDNHLISHQLWRAPLDRLRQFLKDKIETNLPHTNTSPWITALVVGERHGISAENWEVLRNTGTNHLMAIAGLHIGFMSGFIYFLVSRGWRKFPRLLLKMPAQHAASFAALFMAILYSALAGFSIPSQRACIMLAAFLCVNLVRRKTFTWQAYSLALFLVLLINPLDILTDSFWLSFSAVALIIFGVSARLAPAGFWWKWGRIQWVMALGLVPLSLLLFQQCSLISFVANSIAIPWVGFLIVPLSLFGSFLLLISAKIGSVVLILSDKLLNILWIILAWFSHLSFGNWYHVIPEKLLVIAMIGIVILLLPNRFPGKYLGIIALLPMIFYKPPTPEFGDAWFTLLDVGQGLSAVLQTQNHFLVFDAGARLNDNFDMGESVVVPFLRTAGAKKVDMLVISHGDNDHIGGAFAILKRFPVDTVRTSVPEEIAKPVTHYCLAGESWNWDGVNFKFLYPDKNDLGFDNDSSCVLRITAHDKHILLTGDIEKYAEEKMVEQDASDLPTDILVAPHHGSKTSAEKNFLALVHPEYVLFPIGYRNRYHFPHPSVIEAYNAMNTKKYDSVECGAIQFFIMAKPANFCFRKSHPQLWNQANLDMGFS